MFSPQGRTHLRRAALVLLAMAVIALGAALQVSSSRSAAAAKASQGVLEQLEELRAQNDGLKRDLADFRQVQPQHFPVVAGWKDRGHKQGVARQGAAVCFGCHEPVDCEPCHTKGAQ